MDASLASLHALRLFIAIVDEGSIGRGARKQGVAQSNASRVVTGLEAMVGEALLRRTSQGSFLTPVGREFAGRARDVVGAAERLNQFVLEARGAQAVSVRVGASLTIAEQLLPTWIAHFRREVPGAHVEVQALNSVAVFEAARAGSIDLGFVETPHLPGGINKEQIGTDAVVVVVAPNHPWARRRDSLSLEELARTPLVVREHGSGTREALDELLAAFEPVRPVQTLSSNTAIRVAVASGVAPAALSILAVSRDIAAKVIVRVPLAAPLRRPLTAVWTGPARIRGPAASLLAIARKVSVIVNAGDAPSSKDDRSPAGKGMGRPSTR